MHLEKKNRDHARLSHPFYAQGLTLEKVGDPQLILCSCIHLQALAAVGHMIMVAMTMMIIIMRIMMIIMIIMIMISPMIVVMAMTMFLCVAMMTGLTEQKTSQSNQSQFAKCKSLYLKGCVCSALRCRKYIPLDPC